MKKLENIDIIIINDKGEAIYYLHWITPIGFFKVNKRTYERKFLK